MYGDNIRRKSCIFEIIIFVLIGVLLNVVRVRGRRRQHSTYPASKPSNFPYSSLLPRVDPTHRDVLPRNGKALSILTYSDPVVARALESPLSGQLADVPKGQYT
jgi:hypothetical protein